ncbi:uncharacterized protein CTRU02_202895 [Colletotrichum truncatum]|uniref:Uncharacterized protein n=1 Tax=Colletotrichum truncatum TaxID=5467 RepID=A0ACC3ZLK8_COLTU
MGGFLIFATIEPSRRRCHGGVLLPHAYTPTSRTQHYRHFTFHPILVFTSVALLRRPVGRPLKATMTDPALLLRPYHVNAPGTTTAAKSRIELARMDTRERTPF